MSEDRKKIFIAVPSMDYVPVDFANSLALLKKPEDCDWTLQFEIGSLIYVARNKLAEKAVKAGADFVLWLDSDMIFDPDVLLELMEDVQRENVDMVTGLYFRRVPPHTPVLFDQLDLDLKEGSCTWSEFSEVPAELFEIGGAGFGCLLMKTEVFLKVLEDHQLWFSPISTAGEDLSFCWRARQSGYRIFCDPKLTLGHVARTVVDKDYFLQYQEARYGSK